MRELERDDLPSPLSAAKPLLIVGRGRVGRSLALAAEEAGIPVATAGRDEIAAASSPAGAVLLTVPDGAITTAAADVSEGPEYVGHVSGAGTLNLLADAAARGARPFSLHPLQTFADGDTSVQGTPAAVAGNSSEALGFAHRLAESLGMRPFEVAEQDRSAYHAAAVIASNLLVALEESAAELLGRLGTDQARELLAPIVLQTAANWVELGPQALTGPIARGDEVTVDGHRAALRERAPELLPLYDVLVERARAVAADSEEVPA
jgi:predicted short-subunit dehydrogenase-like oxidoreductase (DUF2520 family)